MLHAIALLFLAQAAVLKGELKEAPAQGKTPPQITVDGTTSLPDGAILKTFLYYDHVRDGKALAQAFATVKGGKFSQEFAVFSTRNLPGKYIVRMEFRPDLQNLTVSGIPEAQTDVELLVGTAEDVERETRLVRDQLAGEIRSIVALGDQVLAKSKELEGKPVAAWEPLLREWRAQCIEVQRRADPRRVPEYNILNLDLIAESGLETLSETLKSAARYAAAGDAKAAAEGLTRLRQTAENWISEVAAPKLTDPAQIVKHIDAIRKLLQDLVAAADAPVLPVRRKVVQMIALLDKSLPEDFHGSILEIGTKAVAFFNAAADKLPEAKTLHAELDVLLEKLSVPLRAVK